MSLPFPPIIDPKVFKNTFTYLKQTNEVIELLLTVTPEEYQQEFIYARDSLIQQNLHIAKQIEELAQESKFIPYIYKDLFRENLLLIRLISLVPLGTEKTQQKK